MINDFREYRKLVLWFGLPPNESIELEFKNRDLSILIVETIPEPAILSKATGAVICYNGEKHGAFRLIIEALSKCAKTYGLRVLSIAQNDANFASMYNELRLINWFPYKSLTSPKEHEVAEYMARHYAGPPANLDLEIQSQERLRLSELEVLLLQRAFYDCRKITLNSLSGGRTAKVFQIEAVFNQSPYVPRPLPFFAKVGEVGAIKREFKNYEKYVTHYIPFHLHPGIDQERSILGDQCGIIVGNFVENSKPLREVLRSGHSDIIRAIFLDSLKSWREQSNPHENLNWDIFRPVDVPLERVSAASKL